PHSRSTLFPYTTLFRSHLRLNGRILRADKLRFQLKGYRRIFVIGGGKASGYMAEEVEKLLGSWITRGLVIIPDYLRPKPRGRRIDRKSTRLNSSHVAIS